MVQHQIDAFLTFMDGIRKNPRRTGAVLPSGPHLAKEMAASIDPSIPGTILELGPGTGVFTEALLARGIPEERLTLIEYNPDFCKFLRSRFPRLRLIQGSAFNLDELCAKEGLNPLSAVVSGLPLLNFPVPDRLALVNAALERLSPGGSFVQFTYGGQSSVPSQGLNGTICHGKKVWLNFPPATIWVYRPQTAQSQAA